MMKSFIVEFSGPPKSGKTTLIKRVKKILPHSFSIIREVSADSPVPKRKVLKYLEWSANELINKIIFTEEMVKKEMTFIDCGILSQLSLLRAFEKSGLIKDNELLHYKLIEEHLLMNLKRENIIFYVKISEAKEIERVENYRFPNGFIINRRFLKILNRSYEKTVEEAKEKLHLAVRIFEINGEELPEKNSKKISKILKREYSNWLRR